MARFKLVFKRSVAKDLKKLPSVDVARIIKRIHELAENPRGPQCEKLSGSERYRVRQGIYRIIYEICDQQVLVVVVKIGHRKEVYR